jgi:hypothetical protein
VFCLEGLQLAQQGVILGIGNDWRRQDVVTVIVISQAFAQLIHPSGRVFCFGHGAPDLLVVVLSIDAPPCAGRG